MGKEKKDVISIPNESKYSELEQKIISYLYERPGANPSTWIVIGAFHPEKARLQASNSERKELFEKFQYAVETLIQDKLAKGKRSVTGGDLQYMSLALTAKGEAEAIKQKRDAVTLTVIHIGEEDESE